MRPLFAVLLLLCLLPLAGCVSLSPDVSLFAVEPLADTGAEPTPAPELQPTPDPAFESEPAASLPKPCECGNHAGEISALQTRLTALEVRVSLAPMRSEPKPEQPTSFDYAPAASDADCLGGVCRPQLLPRGRLFGRRQ